MALRAAVGIDYSYVGALQLALDDYNKVTERKQYHETLVKDDESTTCVTIMYSTIEPVAPVQQEPVWEFIGHKGVDPSDPDWKSKVFGEQIDAEDIVPDGVHSITADTITSVQLEVKRAQEGH